MWSPIFDHSDREKKFKSSFCSAFSFRRTIVSFGWFLLLLPPANNSLLMSKRFTENEHFTIAPSVSKLHYVIRLDLCAIPVHCATLPGDGTRQRCRAQHAFDHHFTFRANGDQFNQANFGLTSRMKCNKNNLHIQNLFALNNSAL